MYIIFIYSWGKNLFGTTVYHGHRRLLSLRHYLRSFGQTNQCCPQHYFTDIKVLKGSYPDQIEGDIVPKVVNIRKNVDPIDVIKPCEGSEEWNRQLYMFYSSTKADNQEIIYDSHHSYTQYELWRFTSYLYYPFYEYRMQSTYQRISNDHYKECAIRAQALNKKHERGVGGLWIFDRLRNQAVDKNICYDPFHVLLNNIIYTIQLFLGKREVSATTLQYCLECNMHPGAWTYDYKDIIDKIDDDNSNHNNTFKLIDKKRKIAIRCVPPWQIISTSSGRMTTSKIKQNSTIVNIEEYLDSIYLPTHYSNDFEIKSFLSCFGVKKGIQKIHFTECSMEILALIVKLLCKHKKINSYPDEYLLYYCMLSSLFSKLLAPIIANKDIEDLYFKTVEVVALSEGLYPPSEALMTKHQLVDLIHHVRKCGPLKCWWALPGERSQSAIKSLVSKGGASFYKTVSVREYENTYAISQNYYNSDNLMKHIVDNNRGMFTIVANTDENNPMISFTPFKYDLFNNNKNKNNGMFSMNETGKYSSYFISIL
jgi:hypothetical protein